MILQTPSITFPLKFILAYLHKSNEYKNFKVRIIQIKLKIIVIDLIKTKIIMIQKYAK